MSEPAAVIRGNGKWWLWPVVIIVLAAVLRLYHLGSLPPGIFRDEAEKGFNAWLLSRDGLDAQGRQWPLFVEVFGVTTSAIYQYAALPFIMVGGLNEWTTRLPAALTGILTVGLTWLLAARLWGRSAANWAALMLAVSAWHVPLSRWAQQGIFLPFFFTGATLGLAAFIQEANRESPSKLRTAGGLVVAGICLALAMYAYDPARLFAPLLAVVAVVVWSVRMKPNVWLKNRAAVAVGLVTFAVVVSPVAWLLVTQASAAQARFQYLSVFQPELSTGYALILAIQNYFAHFDPVYLLITGDAEWRHSAGVGILSPVELTFALVGAGLALRRKDRWGIFFLLWIVLAPIPASLTRVGIPHALRTQLALPAWQMLAAFGLVSVLEMVRLKIRRNVDGYAVTAILLGGCWMASNYFGGYAQRSAFNWQFGVKQALSFMNNEPTKNAKVYLHNIVGAEYLVAFYEKMNRPQWRAFTQRESRYHVMPFQLPNRPAPAPVEGAAGYITLPGYAWPEDYAAVPIHVPGNTDQMTPPPLVIMMNPELTKAVSRR